jgi:putative hydrolase of the HAD superfamily
MSKLTTLFWDIGGVILSNGWDEPTSEQAARIFHFDFSEFEPRHKECFEDFETGRITLDEYLDHSLFYRPQSFTKTQFMAYIFAQSTEKPETRAILDELTAAGGYFIAALNNEGLELNNYRIREFNLRRNFSAFFTSCYLGVRKPAPGIYERALGIMQRVPEECLFIDDRDANVVGAQRVGMRTIHYQDPAQLRKELTQHGIMAGVKA